MLSCIKNYKRAAGFSLLEVLIVLTISSVLLLTIYTLFSHHERQYHHQQKLFAIEENNRLALHVLQKQVQHAGDGGCARAIDLTITNHITLLPQDIGLLRGEIFYEQSGHLMVEKGSYERTHLFYQMQQGIEPIVVNQADLFKEGDIVLIANCTHGDLLQLTGVAGNQLYHHANLSHLYGVDAQVMRWEIDSYYFTEKNDAKVALYQKKLLPSLSSVELVDHLDPITIQYGLLTAGKAVWVDAQSVSNWQSVRGFSIGSLIIPLYNQGV